MDTPWRLPGAVELRDGPVLLRRHVPEDAAGVLEQCRDPDTVRFTTVPHPYSPEHAQGFLRHVREQWAAGECAALAVELEGRFAGTLDLRRTAGGWAGIGYGLAPWARGRGAMTRAARSALAWGFDELGVRGVHWEAVVGNEASWRVARTCGFRREGEVRGLLVHRGERLDGWIGSLLPGELVRAPR
ncbi:GNAT family N-acetyltransferase [Kineococcus indalonis]|uniref:GNAT family N-acetyltransferase n=1 Tax=Kineococcus indalonis TaxID=2696566 RepID=UPI001411FE3C|nr:GNAT family N-acetyltransferase [Kineococcus indalonis]NAZ87468.1 GNAT family N-acetyltransferase [Kineococcus indalonis]